MCILESNENHNYFLVSIKWTLFSTPKYQFSIYNLETELLQIRNNGFWLSLQFEIDLNTIINRVYKVIIIVLYIIIVLPLGNIIMMNMISFLSVHYQETSLSLSSCPIVLFCILWIFLLSVVTTVVVAVTEVLIIFILLAFATSSSPS